MVVVEIKNQYFRQFEDCKNRVYVDRSIQIQSCFLWIDTDDFSCENSEMIERRRFVRLCNPLTFVTSSMFILLRRFYIVFQKTPMLSSVKKSVLKSLAACLRFPVLKSIYSFS